jgi:serine/threonine protein kinase
LTRFKREARTAAKLSHPNIVPVYDVGEGGGAHFIVMKYISGVPAADAGLTPRRAIEVMRQVAEAAHFAHEQGIVHRDIKPGNILVMEEPGMPDAPPTAYVTDFGLAKAITGDKSLSMSGDITGTPSYMAPEQASGRLHDIGPATDVWGIGSTLFTLRTTPLIVVPFLRTTSPLDFTSSFNRKATLSPGLLSDGLSLPLVISAATCDAEVARALPLA